MHLARALSRLCMARQPAAISPPPFEAATLLADTRGGVGVQDARGVVVRAVFDYTRYVGGYVVAGRDEAGLAGVIVLQALRHVLKLQLANGAQHQH